MFKILKAINRPISTQLRGIHISPKPLNKGVNFPSLFEDQQQAPIYIERFNSKGFTTTGGYNSEGPMLLVHGLPFQWEVPKESFDEDLPLESLKVFELVRPKPGIYILFHLGLKFNEYLKELIVIGMGKTMKPIAKPITKYLNKLGIQIEIMDTVI